MVFTSVYSNGQREAPFHIGEAVSMHIRLNHDLNRPANKETIELSECTPKRASVFISSRLGGEVRIRE